MTIDCWFISTELDRETLDRFESAMTRAERERANRFRMAADRRRSIVARGALRQLLSRYVEGEVEIVDGAHGKPHLVSGKGVEFNVSHSGDLVAIAVAERPVGVDVERTRPLVDDVQVIARSHFSEVEVDRMTRSPNPDDEFFAIWTAKEAVVKAIGRGLGLDLRSFTVPPVSGELNPVDGLDGWLVCSVPPPMTGYRVAVAARGESGGTVRTFLYP